MNACCYHCAESLPESGTREVEVDGRREKVCCTGCEAAVLLITSGGLTDYYRLRTQAPPRPDAPDEWDVYDRAESQRDLVACDVRGSCEASLVVDGIRCAACSWLIERSLSQLDGVESIRVNPASGRILLRWRKGSVTLGVLLRRLAHLGYRPYPREGAAVDRALIERRELLKRLGVAGLAMMQVMMNAFAVYVGGADMTAPFRGLLDVASLIMATPVVFYSSQPFFASAWRSLRARVAGMDVPISLAIVIGYAASVWNTFLGQGAAVYFDSVTMFAFLLLLARYLESQARHRAQGTADAVARSLPDKVVRERADATEVVERRDVGISDVLQVRAGEVFPADGTILSGATRVDLSLLSGESTPLRRAAGDEVVAGSVNLGQPVRITVTRIGADTRLSLIARLLLRAQAERPALSLLADRVAAGFTWTVLLVAVLTFAGWSHFNPALALPATLAVLVASCPCALSLATPAALTAATNRLSRDGMLVVRTQALEILPRVTDIVFDKTGTLTSGRPVLLTAGMLGAMQLPECVAIAAALEAHSEHPIALAFTGSPRAAAASGVKIRRGQGVEGTVDAQRYRVGNAVYAAALSGAPAPVDDTGVYLAGETGLLARFEIGHRLRPGVAEAVGELKSLGVRVHIASGDSADTVQRVAASLDIDSWRARLTPEAKLEVLRELRASGGVVAAVGDGINDAPILAGADVSVAIGAGSALAQSSADLVLLGESLNPLHAGIGIARRTRHVILQNLAWALAYNGTMLPLAALGFVPPWMSALGMAASSLMVVGNALRLAKAPRTKLTAPAAPGLEVRTA